MCKLIAELVGADKNIVRETIKRLENSSGLPGIDLRFSSEVYGKLHIKLRELGLDPHDSTPHEIYNALQSLTKLHDKFLAKKLNINNYQDPETVLPSVVSLVNKLYMHKEIWSIKPVVIKSILKKYPPKRLMKLLEYRSLESMIKRENPNVLITIGWIVESELWQSKIKECYKKINSNDFELHKINTEYITGEKWTEVAKEISKIHRSNIVFNPEAGLVAVLPLHRTIDSGLTLTTLAIVLHYINEIQMYSSFYKFHQMNSNIGELLATNKSNHGDHAKIAGQSLHWRIIHKYYSASDKINFPEIFQPHLQIEDVAYRKVEKLLYRLEPALHFWNDLDYVGLSQDGGPISFSLMDNAVNLANNLSYDNRVSYHLRDAVWNEVYSRYIGQPNLERQLLRQLDEQFINDSVGNDMELAW